MKPTLLQCVVLLFFLSLSIARSEVLAGTGLEDHGRLSVVGNGIGPIGASNVHRKFSRPKINCNFACARRCMKASRKNVCMRACGTCCWRCQCVPAGTYGNHKMCPCYASLKTHGGHPKCP